MSTIAVVVEDVADLAGVVSAIRQANASGIAEIQDRLKAGAPVAEYMLFGNDHDRVAAAFDPTVEGVRATGASVRLFELGPTCLFSSRRPRRACASSRARISFEDRRTSVVQCASLAVTCSTPAASSDTVVTRAIAGPTAARHANSTFSGHIGALRSTSASTAGMTLCAGTTR